MCIRDRIHQGTFKGEKLQFNDCIAAPDGSFLAGTFYPTNVLGYEKTGKLYRFYPNGNVDIVSENHGCSNGMGFSPNLDYFYHSDPAKGKIVRHSYNNDTHEIGNAEEWYEHKDQGGPDGMTVDSEGYVWSAIWGGSGVIRIDPKGNVVEKINIKIGDKVSEGDLILTVSEESKTEKKEKIKWFDRKTEKITKKTATSNFKI